MFTKLNCSGLHFKTFSTPPQKNSGCISSHASFQPPPSPQHLQTTTNLPSVSLPILEFHISKPKH